MKIKTLNFELKYLSNKFFEEVLPNLQEALKKPNRPYCMLLVKVKNLDFCLPLRSNLPEIEGVGIKTIQNIETGKYKGIDFSKAILIEDRTYLKEDIVQLKDKTELLYIQANDKYIAREFKKYVSGYITSIKENSNTQDAKYQFSTLRNYHNELRMNLDLTKQFSD